MWKEGTIISFSKGLRLGYGFLVCSFHMIQNDEVMQIDFVARWYN